MTRVTAAVVQTGSPVGDTPAALAAMTRLTGEAAERGARLVVFPEAYIGGYPKGLDFGARVGIRTPEGRRAFQHYFDGAIALGGPETQAIGEIARHHGVVLVTGAIERDGGTLYCVVLTFDTDGTLAGVRRKLMPTAMERLIWGFGDGSTLQAAKTAVGTVSGVICWENYMPALRMTMYGQGTAFYCAPTVDDRDNWAPAMQMIATEGRCFVLSACQYMTRRQLGVLGEGTDDPDEVLIRGGSVIVDPFGTILAGLVFNQETILTADLDTDLITQGKYDLDVTGHYARPDIFQLQVNTRAGAAIVLNNPPEEQ